MSITCNESMVTLEGGTWKCCLSKDHLGKHKMNGIDHYILQMVQLLGKDKARRFLGMK